MGRRLSAHNFSRRRRGGRFALRTCAKINRSNGYAAQSPPLWGGRRVSAGRGLKNPPLSPYGDISPKGGDFRLFVPFATIIFRQVLNLFGGNEAWGVLMAATIGVPLYACGGGTIPLLQQWLWDGMSMGSAAAFMLTGPATKITNLGAVKIVLGAKHFALYWAFTILFALLTGWVVNIIL